MDNQDLLNLLANPITLAAILSHILEQTTFFQDEKKSPTAKIGIMVIVCAVAAFVLALFGPGGVPTTTAAWRAVALVALEMVVSSQLFHLVLKQGFPALADYIFAPKAQLSLTQTTGAAGNTSTLSTTVANAPVGTPATSNYVTIPASADDISDAKG